MTPYLPGQYYYATRYRYPFERIIHVLKYWVPHALALALLSRGACLAQAPAMFIAWCALMNLYDVFSRENDIMSVRNERLPVHRAWRYDGPQPRFFLFKAAASFILLLLIAALEGPRPAALLLCLLAGLCFVFFVHNRLPERCRPITHYLLYLGKGMLFITVCGAGLTGVVLRNYGLFAAGFALSYVPNYVARKTGGKRRDDLAPREIGLIRHVLLQPIFFKNLLLAGLALTEVSMLAILLLIDGLTAIEFVFRKHHG